MHTQKWPEVWEMSNTSTSKTIQVLWHIFSLYGLPEQVVSDNGPQFSSLEFNQFMKEKDIKHYCSAPYHPATNGAVERFVKTFKQAMKAGRMSGKSSQEVLQEFLFSYRSTPHAVTGSSPAELFLNRPLTTTLDLLRPKLKDRVEANQAAQKYYFDKRRSRERNFKVGEEVMVRTFQKGKPGWSNGSIQEYLGTRMFLVLLSNGTVVRRHIDQLSKGPPVNSSNQVDNSTAAEELELTHETLEPIEGAPALHEEVGNTQETHSSIVADDQIEGAPALQAEIGNTQETQSSIAADDQTESHSVNRIK
jgi:hypothetical protein